MFSKVSQLAVANSDGVDEVHAHLHAEFSS